MSNKMNWPLRCELQEMKLVSGTMAVNGNATPATLVHNADQYTAAYSATGKFTVTFKNAYKGTPVVFAQMQATGASPVNAIAQPGAYNGTANTLVLWTMAATSAGNTVLAATDPPAANLGFMCLFQDYIYGT